MTQDATEQPGTPEDDEAFYERLYGPHKAPEVTPEDEDLYNAIYPKTD